MHRLEFGDLLEADLRLALGDDLGDQALPGSCGPCALPDRRCRGAEQLGRDAHAARAVGVGD